MPAKKRRDLQDVDELRRGAGDGHVAREGADVAFNYNSRDDLAEETIRKIEGHGRRAKSFKVSIVDRFGMKHLTRDLVQEWGGIDILVNNAGIGLDKPFDKVTVAAEEFPRDDLDMSLEFGDIKNPVSVPGGLGVPRSSIANVPIATFNDLGTVERRFQENPGQIAAIILEPILMNVGLCMPQPGFLEGLRAECDRVGAPGAERLISHRDRVEPQRCDVVLHAHRRLQDGVGAEHVVIGKPQQPLADVLLDLRDGR